MSLETPEQTDGAGRVGEPPTNAPYRYPATTGSLWDPAGALPAHHVVADLLRAEPGGPPLKFANVAISGLLDLRALTVSAPFVFENCYFDTDLQMQGAHLSSFTLRNCVVPAIWGRGLIVDGDVRLDGTQTSSLEFTAGAIRGAMHATNIHVRRSLRLFSRAGQETPATDDRIPIGCVVLDDTTVQGDVYFTDAVIERTLYLRDSSLGALGLHGARLGSDPAVHALAADRMSVTGSIAIGRGFVAHGPVDMKQANVKGSLTIRDGRFRAIDAQHAFAADRMSVAGLVHLGPRLRFDGPFRIMGVSIGAGLDLSDVTFQSPGGHALLAEHLTVKGMITTGGPNFCTGGASFAGAKVTGSFSLRGMHIERGVGTRALNCERIRVGDQLFLDRDVRIVGEVRIAGAEIGGNMLLHGAVIHNPGGVALSAEALAVGGAIRAARMVCRGGIALHRATVGGDLDVRTTTLAAGGAVALNCDGADISGAVRLEPDFESAGQVRFVSARIGVALQVREAILHSAGEAAFVVERASIAGPVLMNAARVTGTTRLAGARVAGLLDLRGTALYARRSAALVADGVHVDGDVLAQGMTATGGFRAPGARIAGRVALSGATLTASDSTALDVGNASIAGDLSLVRAHVTGRVRLAEATVGRKVSAAFATLGPEVYCDLRGLDTPKLVTSRNASRGSTLDLREATIGTLSDDEAGWPTNLKLRDLSVARFAEGPPDPQMRLRWIGLSLTESDFAPGAYDRVEQIYRTEGEVSSARLVALHRERARRRTLGPISRIGNRVLEYTVGFGYRPWRSLIWLAGLLLIGTIAFKIGHDRSLLVAAKKGQQPFEATLYSFDRLIPIFTIGIRENMAPIGWVRYVAAVYTVLGWILTTAVVTGVTQAVRRD